MHAPAPSRRAAFQPGASFTRRSTSPASGASLRPAIDRIRRRLAPRAAVHQGQFEDLTVRLDDDQFQVVVIAVVTTDSAPFLLEGHSMPHQEPDHVVRDVTEQVQADPGLGIGSAFEDRPDQLGPKAGEEGHGFERRFAQLPDRGSMLIAAVEGLVAPQFGLDFAVRRKPGMRRNMPRRCAAFSLALR
jgi:hypothetical protein